MHKRAYVVVALVGRDPLSGEGYLATVIAGHRKVEHLYAFGKHREEALYKLARQVYSVLRNSRFDLGKIDSISLIVPEAFGVEISDLRD